MAIKRKLTRYGYHVIIAIDQLFNALTGGAADETLSSRTYRGGDISREPEKTLAGVISCHQRHFL